MLKMSEENGARNAVLQQAAFFPAEGLSDEAFQKVLLPAHQAVGRKLLREGFLTRTDVGGIALSPLATRNLPLRTAWNENLRSFLMRQVTSLGELVIQFRKAEDWADQANADPERLKTLVFMRGNQEIFSPMEARLAEDARLLFPDSRTQKVLTSTERSFLIRAVIAMEQRRNLSFLRSQSALIVPTLENMLMRVDEIPEQHLYRAYYILYSIFQSLEDEKKADQYYSKWRLMKAASMPAFSIVERGLGELYDPRAGDQTVGAMLKRRKERQNDE